MTEEAKLVNVYGSHDGLMVLEVSLLEGVKVLWDIDKSYMEGEAAEEFKASIDALDSGSASIHPACVGGGSPYGRRLPGGKIQLLDNFSETGTGLELTGYSILVPLERYKKILEECASLVGSL